MTLLGIWALFNIFLVVTALFVVVRRLARRLDRLEAVLRAYGVDPDNPPEIENLQLNGKTPEGHCGCCQRELEEDERKLSLAAMTEDGVQSFEVCRWCLSEHAPNMLAALEADDD